MPHHGCGWVKVPSTHMHAKNTLQMDDSIRHPLCLTYVSVCVCMCMGIPLHIYTPTHPFPDPGWFKSLKLKKSWTNWDNLILFEDLWAMDNTPPMGGCIDGWMKSCQITKNWINLEVIESVWIFMNCGDSPTYGWVGSCEITKNGKKFWPNWDNWFCINISQKNIIFHVNFPWSSPNP